MYQDSIGIDLMTSHHESGTEDAASEARIEQLRLCFERMDDAPSDRLVLFGGDLNVREKEVKLDQGTFDRRTHRSNLAEKTRSSSLVHCRFMDRNRSTQRMCLYVGYESQYEFVLSIG